MTRCSSCSSIVSWGLIKILYASVSTQLPVSNLLQRGVCAHHMSTTPRISVMQIIFCSTSNAIRKAARHSRTCQFNLNDKSKSLLGPQYTYTNNNCRIIGFSVRILTTKDNLHNGVISFFTWCSETITIPTNIYLLLFYLMHLQESTSGLFFFYSQEQQTIVF